jgi:hypothetical protein
VLTARYDSAAAFGEVIVIERLRRLLRIGNGSATAEPWSPSAYRVVETEAGANVNYDCYCGCDAGFALDRSASDPAPEGCCCGNQILVGDDAAARIGTHLDSRFSYRLDVRELRMPWGEDAEVALAVPEDHAG